MYKNKKGQSMVETALILPIVIIILMGIVDFGMAFSNYLVITNATREAARSASIGATDTMIYADVASLTSSLDQTKITVMIYPAQALRKKGDEVSVTIQFSNQLITPVISAIVPNPLKLKTKTVMRME